MITLEELRSDAATMTFWQRHRFFVLVAGVIIISLLLVSISLGLYYSSGASQVDLSLPGYKSIQKEASQQTVEDAFPSSGKLDANAFDAFETLYAKHAKEVVGIDRFDPAAFDAANLQLLNEEAQPAAQ